MLWNKPPRQLENLPTQFVSAYKFSPAVWNATSIWEDQLFSKTDIWDHKIHLFLPVWSATSGFCNDCTLTMQIMSLTSIFLNPLCEKAKTMAITIRIFSAEFRGMSSCWPSVLMGLRTLASLKNVGQQLPDWKTYPQSHTCNIQKPESITERANKIILSCLRLKKIIGLNLVYWLLLSGSARSISKSKLWSRKNSCFD